MVTIISQINKYAKDYACCSASNDEEQKRIETDFRNGAIYVYRELFNLYLHGDLAFSVGK